ncbi:L-glyceraldehyde 3-phosphate reductase [Paenibacillus sp. strain BS8-2]
MIYSANETRYNGSMLYNRTGRSGLKLPAISLGMWHNFGDVDSYENGRAMVRRAFDLGITHFDLANMYGTPRGSTEEIFGRILKSDLAPYRDELIITSKAGYKLWPGPYGDWGSKKYMVASLDQSLKKMGLDYVDIYYSHRPDPNTPLEETLAALDLIVRQGKALYIGISNYTAEQTKEAIGILNELGTPLLVHQPSYSMLNRWIEDGLQDVLEEAGAGSVVFSPLAQGLLTDKYLSGIPASSRAASKSGNLQQKDITEEKLDKIRRLNELAQLRGQTLSQMALAWVLRGNRVTSALIGASSVTQIEENVAALQQLAFSSEELALIEAIL